MSPFKLHVYLCPGVLDLVTGADKPVVDPGEDEDEDYDNGKYY
jgi:hypothetical protein